MYAASVAGAAGSAETSLDAHQAAKALHSRV